MRIVGLFGGRSDLWILAALIAAAAAIRFVALGSQSYWEDESITAAYTHLPLSGLVHQILHDEGNPPLYFFAAKAWAKLFGSGEAGLRSLSALLGVAVVPLAYAIVRTVSRLAALVTAAFVAVNPFLVWYSQEARPYALLVALCAGALLCLIRALQDGPRRRLWLAGWGATSALALATHFFAYPFVAATAVWLLYVRRDRAALAATGGVAAVGIALAPLVAGDRGAVSWVHDAGSLTRRSFHVPIEFLTGVSDHGWNVAGDTHVRFAAAAAVSCLGLALALTRSSGPARRAAARFIALAFAVLVPALALALVRPHADYVYPRYFAPLLLPLLAAIAIGLTGRRLRLLRTAAHEFGGRPSWTRPQLAFVQVGR